MQKDADGNIIEESLISDNHSIDSDGNLYILSVTLEDDSSFGGFDSPYYCQASTQNFEYQSFNGSLIYLSVNDVQDINNYAPIPLIISPNQVNVLESYTSKLNCVHGGYPKPIITWTLNGTYLDKGPDQFYISMIQKNEAGLYACHVSNGFGSDVTHTFDVIVETILQWDKHQYPERKSEGETAEFICIPNKDANPTYEWFINSKSIDEVNHDSRWTITPNKIVITNLQKSDTSVIGCRATSGVQTIYEENDLQVISKAPIIRNKKTELVWFIGQNESFNCKWEAGPIPSIKWVKDGHEIVSNERVNIADKYVSIENVTAEDAGVYECQLSNKYGSDTKKTVVSVYKNTVFEEDMKDIESTIGSTVTFPCNFKFDESFADTIIVGWRFDDDLLIPDDDHILNEGYALQIKNVKKSDEGSYNCFVKLNDDLSFFGEHGTLSVKSE